jgi:gamma-glutamyltranspeptidase/glutathione hydrolase
MRRLALLAVSISACQPAPTAAPATPVAVPAVAARFPDNWPHRTNTGAALGANGAVASDAPLASQVGVDIMRAGGNAVDAAVAVGFALAVVYPEAGNLGGGGFTVVRMADGRIAAIDYREVAPLAATRDMFLDDSGRVTRKSVVGPLASGVPGSVAGLVATHQRFGVLPLARVMAPAIRLAEAGFAVDSQLARSLAQPSHTRLIGQFAGVGVFYPNAQPRAASSPPRTSRNTRRSSASQFDRCIGAIR